MNAADADHLERLADAQERQADALEVIAGTLLLTYDTEHSGYSVEALHDEVRYYATADPFHGGIE